MDEEADDEWDQEKVDEDCIKCILAFEKVVYMYLI